MLYFNTEWAYIHLVINIIVAAHKNGLRGRRIKIAKDGILRSHGKKLVSKRKAWSRLLDSVAFCGATLSSKIHGFFSVCHAPVDLFKKGTR